MANHGNELRTVRKILERMHGEPPLRLRFNSKPIRGGLESSGVLRVNTEFQDRSGRHRSSTMIVKRLDGAARREAAVYEKFVAAHARDIAPRLFAIEHHDARRSTLYLEWVRRINSWPWRNLQSAEELVQRLAHLHSSTAGANATALLPRWDYDAELLRSSGAALQLLGRCRRDPELAPLARQLPSARRLAIALPELRRELLQFRPLPTVVIHGDVHPGNVLVRRRAGREEPILIDWGRARFGSPLEDLSAWLQSLGYWEAQARRRHDTLLAAYLTSRGMERRLSSGFREAYWLAGASNALSGALEYHLSVLFQTPPVTNARKRAAAESARDWLRIIRRAAAACY